MRLKNKKHTHFSRTDNKKYQEQNHKKEKTNNNNKTNIIIVVIFIAFASTIQFSHNTPPHTQHPTKGLAYQGWSIEQHSCCSRHPTACHKQNKPEHKHTCYSAKTFTTNKGWKTAKSSCFINSQNHTHEMRAVPVFTRKQKLATTSRPNQTPNNDKNLSPARH